MKKKDFITLILSTVGGILFSLGLCMALLPQWGVFYQGAVLAAVGLVGIVLLLCLIPAVKGLE